MITQEPSRMQADVGASEQVTPKSRNGENKNGTTAPFVFNGCAVTFTSCNKGNEEPIKAVKDILLSAYRTKRL